MYSSNSSEIEVYEEYLRRKLNDDTILITDMESSSTSNTIYVFADGDSTSTWVELNYSKLWMTMRILKIKQLKKKINKKKLC